MEAYFDNSATTRVFDSVKDIVVKTMTEDYGNPSAKHRKGMEAEQYVRQAAADIAKTLKVRDKEILFTSGGTESNNMALIGTAMANQRAGKHIISTRIEHASVYNPLAYLEQQGFEVTYLSVDSQGHISLEELEAAIRPDTILVSIMYVNNEVGAIEPVLPCYRIVQEFNREHGTEILFHTDGVQAFGKVEFNDAPFDLISISGHKFHGPKGVGALYIRKGVHIPPFILGGGQEDGFRSGTENTPGIAGLGLAAQMATENIFEKQQKMAQVNDYFRKAVIDEIPDVQLNGFEEQGLELQHYGTRCPSVINFSFLGTRGEVLLHTLEQDGIFVSTGSACASHHTGDSHVLQAMSLGHKEIECAIRFSFSEFNTMEEMDFVIDRLKNAVTRFRRLGSFR